MPDESHVTGQLLAALEQGRSLLLGLEEDLYTRNPAPIATSTIGEHVRHLLDGLACLSAGLESGDVDYDRRERDAELELRPAAAIARIDELSGRLDAGAVDLESPLRVRADAPPELARDAGWSDSTVGRELVFGVSHTIHHFALIAMILRSLGGEPPEGFGVAPSTLYHWKEVGRCAPRVG